MLRLNFMESQSTLFLTNVVGLLLSTVLLLVLRLDSYLNDVRCKPNKLFPKPLDCRYALYIILQICKRQWDSSTEIESQTNPMRLTIFYMM